MIDYKNDSNSITNVKKQKGNVILKIWRGVWAALGLEPWWLRPMECSSWLDKHMKRCSTWFPSFDTDTCCIDSDFVWMAGSQQPLDYFLGQPLHFYDTCRSLPLLLLFPFQIRVPCTSFVHCSSPCRCGTGFDQKRWLYPESHKCKLKISDPPSLYKQPNCPALHHRTTVITIYITYISWIWLSSTSYKHLHLQSNNVFIFWSKRSQFIFFIV